MGETAIAKVFMTGRSQAVRLPKAFRVEGDRVRVRREGNRIVLEPMFASTEEWLAALDQYRDIPFMEEGRNQPPMPPAPAWDD
ncbi:antitoxin [Brevundimonas sp. LM2]|uniref:antitoxin n=1 Tax=Brevundimonas sp. LM2 TaxID=1938605 RepID=UPI00209AD558|nr:AbrB/MazE/SpoVT family DNA-binding domain-containing protein [Brevundimonas sp. LM2]